MPTEQAFESILAECKRLFLAKLDDYGPAWRFLRLGSIADKILIKAKRIRRLDDLGGHGKVAEGVETEYIGIANYCLVALVVLRETSCCRQSEIDESAFDQWNDLDTAATELDDLISSTTTLLLRKNHDYDEAWRDMALSSYPDEILSRMARIKHMLTREESPAVSEGLDSQFYDTLNYSILALIRLGFQPRHEWQRN